jgi:recombinational DNA repair protein (RecF pathway)
MKVLPDKCAQCGQQIDVSGFHIRRSDKGTKQNFCDWACAMTYSQERSKK